MDYVLLPEIALIWFVASGIPNVLVLISIFGPTTVDVNVNVDIGWMNESDFALYKVHNKVQTTSPEL